MDSSVYATSKVDASHGDDESVAPILPPSPASSIVYSRGMGMRAQTEQVDTLTKENFSLKLEVYFLRKTLNESELKRTSSESERSTSKEGRKSPADKADVRRLKRERDDARRIANNHATAYQDLQIETHEKIVTLEKKLERKNSECLRLNHDRFQAQADVRYLRKERENAYHTASEHEIAYRNLKTEAQEKHKTLRNELYREHGDCQRFEEVAQENLAKYNAAQDELDRKIDECERLKEERDQAVADLEYTQQGGGPAKYNAIQDELDRKIEECECLKEERDHTVADLEHVQQERDGALRAADEHKVNHQNLKTEANEKIHILQARVSRQKNDFEREKEDLENKLARYEAAGDELDQQHRERERLQEDAKNNLAKYKAAQDELDGKDEEFQRLKQDARANLAKYRSAQDELDRKNDECQRQKEDAQKSLAKYKAAGDELKQKSRECQHLGEENKDRDENIQRLQGLVEHYEKEITRLTAEVKAGKGKISGHREAARPVHGAQSNETWLYRLHELEKRLVAERQARLVDRGGALKRLQEREADIERLKKELQMERVRRSF